jgi:O-antigen/teichoic acid export membrane protein
MDFTVKPDRTLTRKVVVNTAFNIMGKAWGIAIALFLTPYMVRHIGVERYGVWALASVVTSYFGLLDFGIGSSYVKYITEFYTKKDFERINKVVNSGFIFYLAFTAIALILAYFILQPILLLLKIPQALDTEVIFVFWVGLFTFCVSNAASSFVAVQSGLQRMDLYNKVSIAVSIPNVLGTILAIENGYGLRGLIVVNAITMMLAAIANTVIAFKLLPELELSPRHFSGETFKTLFGYGSKLQIARVASSISMQIDKILLSHYLALGLVTFFQLASSIIEQAKSVPLLFLSALIPAFSELDAQRAREKIVDNYIRGTKYITLIAMPLFVFLMVSASQSMLVWMGPGYEKAALIIRILAVGWGLAVISGVRSVVLQAIAKPDIEMRAGLIAAVFNIPLSIIFIKKYGFPGVALGTSLALVASAIYGFERLNRELQMASGFYGKVWIPQLGAICACAGALALGVEFSMAGMVAVDRFGGLLILTVQGLVFCAGYAALLMCFRPLDKWDAALLSQYAPRISKKIIISFTQSRR